MPWTEVVGETASRSAHRHQLGLLVGEGKSDTPQALPAHDKGTWQNKEEFLPEAAARGAGNIFQARGCVVPLGCTDRQEPGAGRLRLGAPPCPQLHRQGT